MSKISLPTLVESADLMPSYATSEAAGADIRANIDENLALPAGESLVVPTGLKFEIPVGFEIQVRPRSGLAAKHGITVLNTPGTIDSDYRGELKIILINHSKKTFIIEPKMRIAQIILAPVIQADFCKAEELCTTARGEQGFGHSGIH